MSTLAENRVQFEAALLELFEGLESGIGTGGTILPARLSIINYVKAKLDELIPEGEGITFNLATEPNISNPLDLLINAHLDECTKDVILSAPLTVLFPTGMPSGSGTPFDDSKTGYVVLPDNFLRLSSFKMADWKKDLSEAISTQNPKYKKQQFKFLRGSVSFPVAVFNWKLISQTNKRIIEYYSISSSHVVEKLFYIPETTAENFVTVNPNLLDSLAWMCAGKIMQITGMVNESKMAQERVNQSYLNL